MTSNKDDQKAPSTSKPQFNYARAIFKSVKKQRLEVTELAANKEEEDNKSLVEDEPDDNEVLRRKAVDKLKQEAARSAERAKTMGVQGW